MTARRRLPEPARTLAALLAAFATWTAPGAPAVAGEEKVEVFEVGPHDTAELPRGKEADGIIGDFVLRNGRVEALVSGNLPERRANMTTFYDAPTPGCIYDLSVRGSDNDQLTYLGPGGLKGKITFVRLFGKGESPLAESGVRAERTAATSGGYEHVNDYALRPGWRHLAILSTYRNHSKSAWKFNPLPAWKGLSGEKTLAGIHTGDSINPPDHQGYATAVCEWPVGGSGPLTGLGAGPGEVTLKPGEARSFLTAVAPGRSPAEAFGVIAALRGPTGLLACQLREGELPVTSAVVTLHFDDKNALRAYPDAKGRIELALPPATYRVDVQDRGRPSVSATVEVLAGEASSLDVPLEPASKLIFQVTTGGKEPRRSPCKVQFFGLDGTPDPELGVDVQAHGCRNQYHSENGHFTQQLAPGKYRIIITRGIEHDHVDRRVTLEPGAAVTVIARLERLVDTRGWVSTDFHNHSTPSGDNYCGTDDRVINLAAEHIEFAPTTEHNRFYDWTPHIKKLGLEEELATVCGIELTGPNAHFNAFPFKPEPFAQDGGAPVWQHDPRLNAIVLRDYQGGGPDRWVHLNHPQVGKFFRDRNADGIADGGYAGLASLIDAAEVWSTEILNPTPWLVSIGSDGRETRRENRTFAWLQLLNQGYRIYCLAVADAHSVVGNGVGGWRTYIPSSTDEPALIDYREIIRNAKAGRMFVTTGPFLDARLDDGTLPGGTAIIRGPFTIRVEVQCTDWIDIDRVQVLVNGRQDPRLNFTRTSHPQLFSSAVVKFRHDIPVSLEEDAHLIVVAVGEAFNLRLGYGKTWESGMRPLAYTNPIYVDLDGKGFVPSGDTLGYPLPLGK
jgi:hypothetical protein